MEKTIHEVTVQRFLGKSLPQSPGWDFNAQTVLKKAAYSLNG